MILFQSGSFFLGISQASFPIAAIVISFLSINYKLFSKADTASELIDLHIDQITPNDAEILIWLDESLKDRNIFQQSLHKVIENENLKTKYLSYPRNLIETGKLFLERKKYFGLKFNKISFFMINFVCLFAELLLLEHENTTRYHEFFPAALVIYPNDETKGISMDVLFSGNSLHSLAATVNLISNFELELLTDGKNRITTTNAPMHRYGEIEMLIVSLN